MEQKDEIYGRIQSQTSSYALKKLVTTIGRSEDCDICLTQSKSISFVHARIEFAKDGSTARIVDCDSSNGTFINDARVQNRGHFLNHGDDIRFGFDRCIFRFTYTHAGTAPPASEDGFKTKQQKPKRDENIKHVSNKVGFSKGSSNRGERKQIPVTVHFLTAKGAKTLKALGGSDEESDSMDAVPDDQSSNFFDNFASDPRVADREREKSTRNDTQMPNTSGFEEEFSWDIEEIGQGDQHAPPASRLDPRAVSKRENLHPQVHEKPFHGVGEIESDFGSTGEILHKSRDNSKEATLNQSMNTKSRENMFTKGTDDGEFDFDFSIEDTGTGDRSAAHASLMQSEIPDNAASQKDRLAQTRLERSARRQQLALEKSSKASNLDQTESNPLDHKIQSAEKMLSNPSDSQNRGELRSEGENGALPARIRSESPTNLRYAGKHEGSLQTNPLLKQELNETINKLKASEEERENIEQRLLTERAERERLSAQMQDYESRLEEQTKKHVELKSQLEKELEEEKSRSAQDLLRSQDRVRLAEEEREELKKRLGKEIEEERARLSASLERSLHRAEEIEKENETLRQKLDGERDRYAREREESMENKRKTEQVFQQVQKSLESQISEAESRYTKSAKASAEKIEELEREKVTERRLYDQQILELKQRHAQELEAARKEAEDSTVAHEQARQALQKKLNEDKEALEVRLLDTQQALACEKMEKMSKLRQSATQLLTRSLLGRSQGDLRMSFFRWKLVCEELRSRDEHLRRAMMVIGGIARRKLTSGFAQWRTNISLIAFEAAQQKRRAEEEEQRKKEKVEQEEKELKEKQAREEKEEEEKKKREAEKEHNGRLLALEKEKWHQERQELQEKLEEESKIWRAKLEEQRIAEERKNAEKLEQERKNQQEREIMKKSLEDLEKNNEMLQKSCEQETKEKERLQQELGVLQIKLEDTEREKTVLEERVKLLEETQSQLIASHDEDKKQNIKDLNEAQNRVQQLQDQIHELEQQKIDLMLGESGNNVAQLAEMLESPPTAFLEYGADLSVTEIDQAEIRELRHREAHLTLRLVRLAQQLREEKSSSQQRIEEMERKLRLVEERSCLAENEARKLRNELANLAAVGSKAGNGVNAARKAATEVLLSQMEANRSQDYQHIAELEERLQYLQHQIELEKSNRIADISIGSQDQHLMKRLVGLIDELRAQGHSRRVAELQRVCQILRQELSRESQRVVSAAVSPEKWDRLPQLVSNRPVESDLHKQKNRPKSARLLRESQSFIDSGKESHTGKDIDYIRANSATDISVDKTKHTYLPEHRGKLQKNVSHHDAVLPTQRFKNSFLPFEHNAHQNDLKHFDFAI